MSKWRHPLRKLLVVFWILAQSGCAHETTFNKTDIHIYEGSSSAQILAESDSLVCVSYNIAFSEKLDEALLDLSNEALPRQVDILLLQEMDAEGAAYMAAQLDLNYYYYPSFIHPYHGRLFGNAILSPWPMSDPRHAELPHANPLTENHRTALAVNVHLSSGVVQVVNAHMSTLIVDLDHRIEQVEAMRDSLISIKGPTIVGGDFNTGTNYEGTLFRRIMREVGFRESRPPPGRTASGGALDIFGYHLKLDHIYYRELQFVTAGVFRESTASDHFPIWSVFKWQEN